MNDPTVFCSQFTRAALEVLAGRRSAQQLRRMSDLDLFQRINKRAARTRPPLSAVPRPIQVRKIHLTRLSERVCEASVIVYDAGRVHAAAVRIEWFRDRWIASAFHYA